MPYTNTLIDDTITFVKQQLQDAEAGHDWSHIQRVYHMADALAIKEHANREIVALSALLHDIADPKFHNGDESLAPKIIKEFLNAHKVTHNIIDEVLYVVTHLSFKNHQAFPNNPSIELQVVQDADRLDAIGAIGVARAFNFGGFKNNLMYHPDIKPQTHFDKDTYKKSQGTTINHFYEKLLLLKDKMNTTAGKAMAERRHQFMLTFLDEFYQDWYTKDADESVSLP
ncbi:HD domain-containing protein [Riemerella columbina]|uniref:HD domain-containing protein n=1 Tax=Riemerella columbina TaxID=103810 RepID=UPI00037596A7|nr:HD domain-containing protein [Riemerella columbina]